MQDSGVRYALRGDVRIAYRTFGDGPVDLLVVGGAGPFTSIDDMASGEPYRALIRPLASFARVIIWDPQGLGLSDHLPDDAPDRELWVEDALGVMRAADTDDPAMLACDVLGFEIGACLATRDPSPISRLIVFNASALLREAPDYPPGVPDIEVDRFLDRLRRRWGTRWFADIWAPSLAVEEREALAAAHRRFVSPRQAHETVRYHTHVDLRPLLGAIAVPTLVLHRSGLLGIPVAQGRYIADHVRGACFVELDGRDQIAFAGDAAAVVSEVATFLVGGDLLPATDTLLRAVLFTDIVSSAATAASSGDARWRDMIERHDAVSAELVRTFSGELVKSTGDGILATFNSVTNAVRCADTLRERLGSIDIRIRAGVHVGDVALREGDVTGSVVNVARRVCDLADDGSIFVSGAVPPALAGSAFTFTDRGSHELNGVPGEWRLFEAAQ